MDSRNNSLKLNYVTGSKEQMLKDGMARVDTSPQIIFSLPQLGFNGYRHISRCHVVCQDMLVIHDFEMPHTELSSISASMRIPAYLFLTPGLK